MLRMRPCATALRRKAACTMPGNAMSSTNSARPVRRRRSSLRVIGAPKYRVVISHGTAVGRTGNQVAEELAFESPRHRPAYFVARMIKDWARPGKEVADSAPAPLMPG